MKRAVLGALVFLLTAGAIALPKVLPMFKPGSSTDAARPGNSRTSAPPTLSVHAIELRPTAFAETVTATGTLRADEGAELQAEISGKITDIHFQEGTAVRRGDLLVKLNDADLQASLKRAAARKMLAEIRERRLAKLLREGGTNQQDYDAAASELQVQLAEISLIEAQIAKTEVRAPFDGVIGLRFVSVGSFVSPTSRIATLQNLTTIKVDFAVPEKYATRVQVGQIVAFTVAGDTSTYTGEIFAIEPRIDETTRTLLLRASSPNPEGRLRPGTFANVEFTLAETLDALLVPAAAVVPGLIDKNVFVIENGKAARRSVQTGVRTESTVQIIAGLKAGDQVIISGVQSLRPGLAVAVRAPTE